jgi:hypothetical protein
MVLALFLSTSEKTHVLTYLFQEQNESLGSTIYDIAKDDSREILAQVLQEKVVDLSYSYRLRLKPLLLYLDSRVDHSSTGFKTYNHSLRVTSRECVPFCADELKYQTKDTSKQVPTLGDFLLKTESGAAFEVWGQNKNWI